MSARFYRWLRALVGSSVLLLAIFAFAGAFGMEKMPWTDGLTTMQFFPSALAAAKGSMVAVLAVAAILVLTVLFGRVYCAMLCPLGLLMDVVARLAGRNGKNRKLPYHRGYPWIRWAFLATVVGTVATGGMALAGFLDPYSLFGRMTASTVRPVVAWITNSLAVHGWVNPMVYHGTAWPVIGIATGLLVIVAGLAVWRGRIWCNTVCPVGTVLGLVSKVSLFGLRLSPSQCMACARCENVCPSQCLDFRTGKIDHSRCTMCLQCMAVCRKSGVRFGWLPGRRGSAGEPAGRSRGKENPSQPAAPAVPAADGECCSDFQAPDVPRRAFFLAMATLAAADADGPGHERGHGQGKGKGNGKGNGRGNGHGKGGGGGCGGNDGLSQHNKIPVMPPGVVDRARFQSLCTACHLCVARCPEQVLRPALAEYGWSGFLQPLMDFDQSFCGYECRNCGEVCPTGAITVRPLAEKQITRMGMVHFFKGRCVVHRDGTSCGACAEHCPTQAVHMVPYRDGLTIPSIEPDLCIGCGACEYICPVRPDKAIVVDGLPRQETARAIERGGENTVREKEEEFPF